MTVQNPAIFLQAESHPAEDVRRLFSALTRDREGILWATDLEVTEKSGTPNMSVDVAGGRAFIKGDEATYQGTYFVENRGTENLAIATADSTNARKDLVVARVRDSAYSGATDAWELAVVTGTPAASPAEPSVPDNALVLALVDVPASDTAVTNAQITDRRTLLSTPSAKVRRTATQALPNTTFAPVQFSASDLWDDDGMHSPSSNNTRVTIPSGWGGKWLAIARITWAANGTGDRSMRFSVSGTPQTNGNTQASASSFADTSMTAVAELDLDAGQYVELDVYQSSGGNLNLSSAELSLRWIAA